MRNKIFSFFSFSHLLVIFLFPSVGLCAELRSEVKGEIERQLLEDANGNLRIPDNTIVASDDSSYDFMSKNNRFKVYFKKDPYAGEYNVKYVRGDSWVAFKSLSGLAIINRAFKPGLPDGEPNTLWRGTVSMKDKNRFIYPKVFESPSGASFSVEYLMNPKELLEEIVLDRKEDVRSISQELTIHNVELKEKHGMILFYKPGKKEILFSIPKPKMYEQGNRNNQSTGLHYELKSISNNRYLLTKVIDEGGCRWLADPSRTYPVVIDITISFGSEYVFNPGGTTPVSIAVLDTTHFVACYRDSSNSNKGTAIIGTISNVNEISYGSEYIFNPANTDFLSVAALDSTHFVVAYRDVGNSLKGTAIVGTVSNGNEIDYGSEYLFNNGNSLYPCVNVLDSTHFVVVYRDDSDATKGMAVVGVVSSVNQIAFGSEYMYDDSPADSMWVGALDSTHFVIAYRDDTPSYHGACIVGTVSNDDEITYGSEYIFNADDGTSINVAALDSTHFVVLYVDWNYSTYTYGTAIVGTISNNNEIAFGLEKAYRTAQSYPHSLAVLDSTHFVVTYKEELTTDYGTAIGGTISGTDISYGSTSIFNSGATIESSAKRLDGSHFVVGYRDSSNSNYGTAVVGAIAGLGKPMVIIVE